MTGTTEDILFRCCDCFCVFDEWGKSEKHREATGHRVEKEKQG